MRKVQPVKVSTEIIKEFEEMLRNNEIKEGDKLPNEIVLAEQLGVSRMSVREALHTMRLMGVVSQRPRIGTIVINGNPDRWPKNITLPPPALENKQDTMDFLVARRLMEGVIARQCAQNATEENIAEIRRNMENLKDAVDRNDVQEFIQYDSEFHFLVAKASNNSYLMNVYLLMNQRINDFMNDVHKIYPGTISDSYNGHSVIFDDIISKNAGNAERNMKKHIGVIIDVMEGYYKEK